MATFGNYPENYLLFNSQRSKNLAIIMQIEGIEDLFGISETFTKVRYGDPGIVYGLPGLVYGSLRRLTQVKPWIILDQSMTIGQKIEPEQGKANLGTLTMTLIDKDGQVSELIAPGVVVDEIITRREFKIFLGYRQSSFPEDYLLVYRGYCTSIDCPPGLVKFQLSDSTTKKRQPIFNTPSTNLSSGIDAVVTTIPVDDTAGFHQQILGPDSTYDPIVRTYIKIDDEYMEYGPSGITSPTSFTVTRGGSSSLGTTPSSHDVDAAVMNAVQLGGNVAGVNCIDLALKILLSGWNGPCEENIEILSFVFTYDPVLNNVPNVFVLLNLEATRDLGLTVGDYFTITDASVPGNNVSGIITEIGLLNDRQLLVYTDQTFAYENPTSAVVSFRSKYDTLPVTCGSRCRMRDVDVETMEMVRDTYFTSATSSNMRFFYEEAKMAKDVIDTDIFLPVGCYGISRFGRISMSITKPPLPGVGKLIEVNWTNVIDPDKIHVTRATNSRNFFNLISFEYNYSPALGAFTSLQQFLDTNSLNLFNQVSKLPITAPGLTDDLGGATIAQARGRALLNRYKNIALILELTVNWSVGSLIEVSDIVLLRDEGKLQIMNFETGKRNLGIQLFEVIDRSYNIAAGNVKLKLMGGLGFNVDSRFGLYSPSSNLDSGSSTSSLRLVPSYGQTSVTNELRKWRNFSGLPIQVHPADWSSVQTSILVGEDPDHPGSLLVDPPLATAPGAGEIVDIAPYPTSTDKNEDALYKTLYAHYTPSIPVVSGTSGTVFDVSLGDAALFTVGNTVIVRNPDFSVLSAEIKVLSVVGTTITLEEDLGFTPNNTYTVEGIGYKDSTSFYRYG